MGLHVPGIGMCLSFSPHCATLHSMNFQFHLEIAILIVLAISSIDLLMCLSPFLRRFSKTSVCLNTSSTSRNPHKLRSGSQVSPPQRDLGRSSYLDRFPARSLCNVFDCKGMCDWSSFRCGEVQTEKRLMNAMTYRGGVESEEYRS